MRRMEIISRWVASLAWILCLLLSTGNRTLPAAPRSEEMPQPRLSPPAAEINFGPYARFTHLSLEEGLSQSIVQVIMQDSRGFMWFGTEDGLNRFDGYSISIYRHDSEDPDSISLNDITALAEDPQGMLWVGTNGGGLNRFDRNTGRFTRFINQPTDPGSLSSNDIGAILVDWQGTLWVGTQGGGLNRYERQTGKFTRYINDTKNHESLGNNVIFSLAETRGGALWIGTGNGLDRYDPRLGVFDHFLNGPRDPQRAISPVWTVMEDGSGMVWAGVGTGGLFKIDPQTGGYSRYQNDSNDPNSLSGNSVRSILKSRDGALWAGTADGGLNQFDSDNGQWVRYQHDPIDPDSLSSNLLLSLFEDRAGDLWVGTYGGGINQLSRYNNRFVHYKHDPRFPDSLSENLVWALAGDPGGDVWVGTDRSGLDQLDHKTGSFNHYRYDSANSNSLSSDSIRSLFIPAGEFVWVGTTNGLNRLDIRTGQVTRFQNRLEDAGSLSDGVVQAILQDPQGDLWAGTSGGGLNRMASGTQTFAHFRYNPVDPASISNNIVNALQWDPDGYLWVGTQAGIDRMNIQTGQFDRYLNRPDDPDSLSPGPVTAVLRDHQGIIWCGTTDGLNRLDQASGRFTHYRVKQGLANNTVYSILEDEHNYLWVGTNNGLSRLDPARETFTNFDRRDGLQSNEFNGSAGYKSQSGELFFGGINGFNIITPDNILPNPFKPPVVVTALTQGGDVIQPGALGGLSGDVTLDWPRNYFEFEFAALNFTQPERNRYAYRLENFDREWNTTGNRRYGKYTNLPGGTYTLQIKGSNNDGVWNEGGTTLKIVVVPPFWERWEFQLGLAILVLGAIFTGFRLRDRSLRNHNQELARQVEERTHEINQRRLVAEGLREILIQLNSNRPLEESLKYIACQVNLLIGADRVVLFQIESGKGDLKATYRCLTGSRDTTADGSAGAREGEGKEGSYSDTLLQWFTGQFDGGEARFVPDVNEVSPGIAGELADIGSILFVPVLVGGEAYGGLAVMFARKRVLSQDEVDMVLAFADQIALAVGNSRLRQKAAELAVVSERNRLARDLHDAVTQTLFSASLIAEALPSLWEADQREGRQLLGELRQLTRGALAEMRTLLMELRPAVMAEAKMTDLLRQLAESVTGRTGIQVSLDIRGNCNIPSDVKTCLYRIAQEALTNVVKHAGAKHVSLRLATSPDGGYDTLKTDEVLVELEIADDGCGFDPNQVLPDHFGLMNIRERAQAIDARLEIESRPGRGTRVISVWHGKADIHGG